MGRRNILVISKRPLRQSTQSTPEAEALGPQLWALRRSRDAYDIHTHVCVCVCIYTYVYICIYTHACYACVYIYIYIYE